MKKLTMFLDRTFQEALEKDIDREWSVAHRIALNALAAIVVFGNELRPEIIPNPKSPFEKFLSGVNCESHELKNMFKEPNRIEARLALRFFKTLTLELKGYRTGAKRPYIYFEFNVSQDGTSIIPRYYIQAVQ